MNNIVNKLLIVYPGVSDLHFTVFIVIVNNTWVLFVHCLIHMLLLTNLLQIKTLNEENRTKSNVKSKGSIFNFWQTPYDFSDHYCIFQYCYCNAVTLLYLLCICPYRKIYRKQFKTKMNMVAGKLKPEIEIRKKKSINILYMKNKCWCWHARLS